MSQPPTSHNRPWREIVQPFIDLVRAPRALWGVNLSYLLEGLAYFGVLGYLTLYFSEFVFRGVAGPETWAHNMVMVLTAGITIAMFFLGFVADKKGVRFALVAALLLLLAGRMLISAAPTVLGLGPAGVGSALHLLTMAGIILVVVGYGMYQPAAYAAVRQFTTPRTAGMAYAMLYALMNLGGWLPTFAFLLRDQRFLGLGIPGVFWVYTGVTALGLMSVLLILTPRVVQQTVEQAQTEKEAASEEKQQQASVAQISGGVPLHLWFLMLGVVVLVWWRVPHPVNWYVAGTLTILWVAACWWKQSARWLSNHPLADGKFFFFIFAFIPAQTLFTYNWLVLPEYISRAFSGWVGKYFEIASNANPLLIFILVPMVAALTQKRKVYNLMILGTLVMSLPAFLLALDTSVWTLGAYILLMTVGEAIWQPRFLQYAAEIAPPGRTGQYMGVAQLPWFLTKMLVPMLYSGWMMDHYCPAAPCAGARTMWLIFACIALTSSVLLFIARPWLGRDFKSRAD